MIGFLDPEGKLHECNSYEHLDLAVEITEKMGKSFRNRLDAENYLLSLGWIAVRARDVYGNIGYFKSSGSEERLHLTEKQKDWLNKIYESVNTSKQESIDQLFEWDK